MGFLDTIKGIHKRGFDPLDIGWGDAVFGGVGGGGNNANNPKALKGRIGEGDFYNFTQFASPGKKGQADFFGAVQTLPFLQMMGGLFGDPTGAIQGALPEGMSFISPTSFGPYGDISRQASNARSAGRTGLASRGLSDSGAAGAFGDSSALGEAIAKQAATRQLMMQLPMLLGQARSDAIAQRKGRESLRQMDMSMGGNPWGQIVGSLAGAGLGSLGGGFGAGLGLKLGGLG